MKMTKATERALCKSFAKWRDAVEFNDGDVDARRNAFSSAATRMADFLESLLPSATIKPTE